MPEEKRRTYCFSEFTVDSRRLLLRQARRDRLRTALPQDVPHSLIDPSHSQPASAGCHELKFLRKPFKRFPNSRRSEATWLKPGVNESFWGKTVSTDNSPRWLTRMRITAAASNTSA